MNHHVPEYDVDQLYAATSSAHSTQKNMQENEISELVWHNGQPGIHNQRLFKTSPPSKSQQQQQHLMEQLPPPAETESTTQLFMQEDEMASWLHYPLEYEIPFDQHLNDLLYHPPGPLTAPSSSSTPQQPSADLRPTPPVPQPMPPFRQQAHPSTSGLTQFAHLRPRVLESGQSAGARKNELSESAVVGSSDTPTPSLFPVSWSSVNVSGVESIGASGGIAGVSIGGDGGGYMTMSKDVKPYGSSVSGGSATATADPMARPPDDRKRKGVESSADTFNTDYQGEDREDESYEAKRQCRGTASGKRSRAAEVHNLSERKRRDRINEKMKALGELIPRCTKTDKASLLDEAIDYLKSLQVQVQMMSMGSGGFVPMMFPGVQQYMPMPPMGYGMGMGMETRMNRPMVPFPAFLAGQGYQFPAFPVPPAPPFDPSRTDHNPMETVFNPHNPQHVNIYQQYLGSQQIPAHQVSQLPGNSIASTSKTSTSMDPEDNGNCPSQTDTGYKRS